MLRPAQLLAALGIALAVASCGPASPGDDADAGSDDGEQVDAGADSGPECRRCDDAPEGWWCEPDWASDGLCDCGCGADDPACFPAAVGESAIYQCHYNGCPYEEQYPTPQAPWLCMTAISSCYPDRAFSAELPRRNRPLPGFADAGAR